MKTRSLNSLERPKPTPMKVYTVTFSFGVLSVDVLVEATNPRAAQRRAVVYGNANARRMCSRNKLRLTTPFGVGAVRISSPRFSASAVTDVKEPA